MIGSKWCIISSPDGWSNVITCYSIPVILNQLKKETMDEHKPPENVNYLFFFVVIFNQFENETKDKH